MTAVNPIPPNATPERDQRPYEPSMEEILASIRRIIADDQSLPGRQDAPADQAPAPVATSEPEPAIVRVLRPVPPVDVPATIAIVERQVPAPEVPEDAPSRNFVAHGAIAPQYATPEGPVAVHAPSEVAETYSTFDGDHIEQPAVEDVFSDQESHHDLVDDGHAFDRQPDSQPAAASVYDEPIGRHRPNPFRPAPVDPSPLFSAATGQSITSAFNTLAATRLADNSDELLSMSQDMIRPLLKTWLDENLPSMVERLVRAEIERVARGGR